MGAKAARNRVRVVAIAALGLSACGGSGGSGVAPRGGTTIEGNVSRAMTSALELRHPSWLSWLGRCFTERAYATPAPDTALDRINVSVGEGKDDVSGATDGSGNFDLVGVSSGDVTVAFSRGSCNEVVPLSDVITNSTIILRDTTLDCNDATPAEVNETFDGLLQNKPASQSANLQVIAQAGATNRARLVKTDSATRFEDENGNPTSFSDFNQSDLIEASGRRDGTGGASTLNAVTVKKIPIRFGSF